MATQIVKAGKGITVKVDGDMVQVTFDASKDFGPSASGKTTIVATTSGNIVLPNGVTIGVNAYRK